MLIAPEALVAIVVAVVIIVLASFARLRTGSRPPVRLDLWAKSGSANKNREGGAAHDVSPSTLAAGAPATKAAEPMARDPERVARARKLALEQLEIEEMQRRTAAAGAMAARARRAFADEEATDPGVGQEKSLNAFFNFNGHTFDAYETLGIPAGSSIETARGAFEQAAARTTRDAIPFLEEALRAIERRR